jgi:hypothetical protein
MQQYAEQGDEEEVIAFIYNLSICTQRSHHVRYSDRLFPEFLANSDFQHLATQAATKEKRWDVIQKLHSLAIDMAKEDPVLLFHAHRSYISILVHNRDGELAVQDQIAHHCKRALACGTPLAERGGGVSYSDVFSVVDALARIDLMKALSQLEEVEKKLSGLPGQKSPPGQKSSPDQNDAPLTPIKFRQLPAAKRTMPDVKNLLDSAMIYGRELASLVQDTDVWMNSGVYCCLAWYYTQMGDEQEARKSVAKLMAAALGLLSDTDPSDDWFAFLHLAKVLHVMGDFDYSRAAWEMLSILKPNADDQLCSCAVCGEEVVLDDGDRICLECSGPLYLHAKCEISSGEAFSHSCREDHRFMELGGKERQAKTAKEAKIWRGASSVSIENWKDQLVKKYALDGVELGRKATHPSILSDGHRQVCVAKSGLQRGSTGEGATIATPRGSTARRPPSSRRQRARQQGDL